MPGAARSTHQPKLEYQASFGTTASWALPRWSSAATDTTRRIAPGHTGRSSKKLPAAATMAMPGGTAAMASSMIGGGRFWSV